MRTLARLLYLATGVVAAERAPQTAVPFEVAREIATTSSGTHGGPAFSAQLLQGPVSGSAQLHQAPAVVLQRPVPVAPTLPATQSTQMGVGINDPESLLLIASAMTFLTGWDGSDAVTLLSQLVCGVGAAWVIWTPARGANHTP